MPPSHGATPHTESSAGWHSRPFTFHILCTFLSRSPLCFPGQGMRHQVQQTFAFSLLAQFVFVGQYVCRYVGMDECVYVAQRASESHREAQRGPERPREPCVCGEAQNGRAWIEQGCHALGWLAGGLAGWLTPRGLRRALGLQLSGMYCVVLSSGNFEPRGKLGIQLSVMYGLVFC